MASLIADQIGHRYGTLLVFRRLSMRLAGGETLAVTGANGAGKSTLLRVLAGLLTPKAGTVTLVVDGTAVPNAERPRHAGLVAPALDVYDDLTARENLAFVARARRLTNADARIDSVLERVGLSSRADDRVAAYSSGLRQRVKYAAALLADPPLLLLDEPTATLDAAGRTLVDRVVETQRAKDGLVVIATNRPDEAERHDRTLRIEDYQ